MTIKSESAAGIEKITRNEAGQIVIHLSGQGGPVTDAVVARCFPWTLPESYVSIRDRKGKELALLETLEGLDPTSRAVVEDEIRDKIFNPKILRIAAHTREFGVTSIAAETDRGEVTFEIRTRDDIRILSPTQMLLRDADGNAYEVPDISRLDAVSRKYLEEYL